MPQAPPTVLGARPTGLDRWRVSNPPVDDDRRAGPPVGDGVSHPDRQLGANRELPLCLVEDRAARVPADVPAAMAQRLGLRRQCGDGADVPSWPMRRDRSPSPRSGSVPPRRCPPGIAGRREVRPGGRGDEVAPGEPVVAQRPEPSRARPTGCRWRGPRTGHVITSARPTARAAPAPSAGHPRPDGERVPHPRRGPRVHRATVRPRWVGLRLEWSTRRRPRTR